MIPSDAIAISSIASTASGRSIFATMGMPPAYSRQRSRSRGFWTKESANRSTPASTPAARCSRSRFVGTGVRTGTPGRLNPAREVSVPPCKTVHTMRSLLTESTCRRMKPSSRKTSSPFLSCLTMPRNEIGISPSSARAAIAIEPPSSSSSGRASSPMRYFGPGKSSSTAASRPTSRDALRTLRTRLLICSGCAWEPLMRIASTLSAISFCRTPGFNEAGPTVAMILTRSWMCSLMPVAAEAITTNNRPQLRFPRPHSSALATGLKPPDRKGPQRQTTGKGAPHLKPPRQEASTLVTR